MSASTRTEDELDNVAAAQRYADRLSGPAQAHAIQAIHSWIYRQRIPAIVRSLPEVAHTLSILNGKADA